MSLMFFSDFSVKSSVSRDVLFLGGICASLTLQNSSYTLLRRYSSGVLREEASSQSILAMGELLKMTFCIWMISRGSKYRRVPSSGEDEGSDDEGPREPSSLVGQLSRLATTSLPMAVPAVIFLAMNLLSFISLRRISASAFTLIQQSKIIFVCTPTDSRAAARLCRGRGHDDARDRHRMHVIATGCT